MAQAFGLVGQDLVEKGQLTPGQLDKAQKVASALERGEIDIRGLVECSGGKSGYSLLDFLITPARAGGDCTVPSVSAGDAFITLTQDEKIACIELLSGLAKDYLRKQLDGTGNAQVPEWVSEVAGQIRKIEVDYPNARELLVSFGLAGDSIRELAIYKLGGAESVATYRQLRDIASQFGEVAESAVSSAVDAVATEKGLSAKDRADLKLLATTGVFATVAMVGVKGGGGDGAGIGKAGTSNNAKLLTYSPTFKYFKGDEAIQHFSKHGAGLQKAFGKSSYGIKNYLDDANYTIQNGKFVPELNGYVKLIGGEGSAKYGFVGLDRSTGSITTFHIKPVSELMRSAPSLGLSK